MLWGTQITQVLLFGTPQTLYIICPPFPPHKSSFTSAVCSLEMSFQCSSHQTHPPNSVKDAAVWLEGH